MATSSIQPIPQNPLEECFAWRDWLQKLGKAVGSSSGGGTTTPLGYLNVMDFGVNGSASDPANMVIAIQAAITQQKKLYAPEMLINMGTTTLVFPATCQNGFHFECDAGCIILYSGTGDAISINSTKFSKFHFGAIIGGAAGTVSGVHTGIHIKPTSPNITPGFPPGEIAVVGCDVFFNTIQGFYTGIFADCGVGAISQNTIVGNVLICGQAYMPPHSMSGIVCGIRADGLYSPANNYQGNQWNINYIVGDPSSYILASTTWVGIIDGSATMADQNTVNTYQYGAIDGIVYPGFTEQYGIWVYGAQNLYIGSIIDLKDCVTIQSTGVLATIVGPLSSSHKLIVDNSAVSLMGFWHWTWSGASEGRNGDLTGGTMPLPLSPTYAVCNPTGTPAIPANVLTVVPVGIVASGPIINQNILTSSGGSGGVVVSRAGVYTLKGGLLITCGVASNILVGIGINAGLTVVAANSTLLVQAAMSCTCDVYLNAGDTVYLGALLSNNGNVTASALNFLSVIGPLGG